jgi:hypothetical protein
MVSHLEVEKRRNNMENDKRLLAAAIFALAAAYFLTNLHKATAMEMGGEGRYGGVYIHNTVTGSVVFCMGGGSCMAVSRDDN